MNPHYQLLLLLQHIKLHARMSLEEAHHRGAFIKPTMPTRVPSARKSAASFSISDMMKLCLSGVKCVCDAMIEIRIRFSCLSEVRCVLEAMIESIIVLPAYAP